MDSDALTDIEDYLFPKLELDAWQRSLYYHLLRYTRAIGKESELFGISSLSKTSGLSMDKVRNSIRKMHAKGCIIIEDRSRNGHLVRVLLPSEIPTIVPQREERPEINIETEDFFTGRNYVEDLLAREGGRCFYCLREIDAANCELDHVDPQANGVDNSYRNIVSTCHECNSTKQGRPGEEHIRSLYRDGLLSKAECQDRLSGLDSLRSGKLVPRIQ